jgi:hypothetical protein
MRARWRAVHATQRAKMRVCMCRCGGRVQGRAMGGRESVVVERCFHYVVLFFLVGHGSRSRNGACRARRLRRVSGECHSNEHNARNVNGNLVWTNERSVERARVRRRPEAASPRVFFATRVRTRAVRVDDAGRRAAGTTRAATLPKAYTKGLRSRVPRRRVTQGDVPDRAWSRLAVFSHSRETQVSGYRPFCLCGANIKTAFKLTLHSPVRSAQRARSAKVCSCFLVRKMIFFCVSIFQRRVNATNAHSRANQPLFNVTNIDSCNHVNET